MTEYPCARKGLTMICLRSATFAAGILVIVLSTASAADEARPATNPATQPAERTIHVLYVEGAPRWEYRYLKTQLIRDRTIRVSCLLLSADRGFKQEADAPVPDFGPDDPRTGATFPGPIEWFPNTLETLRRYDAIVLGDVDFHAFTLRDIENTAEFVKRGGALALIAGPRHGPATFRESPLAPLLPVRARLLTKEEAAAGFAEPWNLSITEAGLKRPCFAGLMMKDGQLPPLELFWYCRGVVAAEGAEVLATHPKARGDDDKPLPIMAAGRHGAGRTLYIGSDETWRWRGGVGDPTRHARFWAALLHDLATPLPTSRPAP